MDINSTSTRDRIINAALDLFSGYGYDGVSVDQIAAAAGIKGPSIYKHFKSKEDILRCLLANCEEYYSVHFGDAANPASIPHNGEELMQISLRQIGFTLHDEKVKKIRRLLTKEQFRNAQLAEFSSKYFVYGLEHMYTAVFSSMISSGVMRDDDVGLLAFEYIAPISVLIHLIDREPQRSAECEERIRSYIARFVSMHCIK